MITEELDTGYPCPEPDCERVFDSPQALHGHALSHRPAVVCPECGKVYKTPGALGNHRMGMHAVASVNGHKSKRQLAKERTAGTEVTAGDILDAVITMVCPKQSVPVAHVRPLLDWYAATEELITALRS